jgi:glycosylphosphatidylinositol transamidase (GPIT) subunit GPI8
MENRKTSMQELFDNLQAIDIAVPIGVKQIFLDKEEEQIADAFYSGYEDRDLFQHGHDYYNKTYGK